MSGPSGKQHAHSPLPWGTALVVAGLADRLEQAASGALAGMDRQQTAADGPQRLGYYRALQAVLDHLVSDEITGDRFGALLGFVERVLRHGPQTRQPL